MSHENLLDFMRRSPLYDLDDLDFPRDVSPTRANADWDEGVTTGNLDEDVGPPAPATP